MNPQTQSLIPRASAVLNRYIAATERSDGTGLDFDPGVTRSELKKINAGLGRTTIRRVMCAALFGAGGVAAIRAWRATKMVMADRSVVSYAAHRMEDDLIDAAWMTDEEAMDTLAAMRPHSFAG